MLEALPLAAEQPLAAAALTFAIVALAEMGDKSQLVCMTLASRHRGWPVFFGAALSFALLNLLAVVFGTAVATWLPFEWVMWAVAALFAVFGAHALLAGTQEHEEVQTGSSRSIALSTFLIIFASEFGDKTQIAVAGLSTAAHPLPVWTGATLALGGAAAGAVIVGRTLLQRIPLILLKRLSGALFLLLALLTLTPLLLGS